MTITNTKDWKEAQIAIDKTRFRYDEAMASFMEQGISPEELRLRGDKVMAAMREVSPANQHLQAVVDEYATSYLLRCNL